MNFFNTLVNIRMSELQQSPIHIGKEEKVDADKEKKDKRIDFIRKTA